MPQFCLKSFTGSSPVCLIPTRDSHLLVRSLEVEYWAGKGILIALEKDEQWLFSLLVQREPCRSTAVYVIVLFKSGGRAAVGRRIAMCQLCSKSQIVVKKKKPVLFCRKEWGHPCKQKHSQAARAMRHLLCRESLLDSSVPDGEQVPMSLSLALHPRSLEMH